MGGHDQLRPPRSAAVRLALPGEPLSDGERVLGIQACPAG